MTDDTGPPIPESGAEQARAHWQVPVEGQSAAAYPPQQPPSEEQQPPTDRSLWQGAAGAGPPPPQGGEAHMPDPAPPAQPHAQAPQPMPPTGPWAGQPNTPVAGTGQWSPGAGAAPPGPDPHAAPQGGGPGMGAPPMGGPGAGPPGGPGAPGPGPYGAAGFPPPGPPAPRQKRRGMPLWAVLLIVIVVALGSAGIGGALGGSLGVQTGAAPQPEQSPSPKLNTEIPTDAPSRDPGTIAGVAQRVSPSVVSIQDGGTTLSGNGSGFVIEDDRVVTNNHVASALEEGDMEVAYSNGETSGASVVGTEPASDLAVLELESPISVQALEFGDSRDATVGDEVIAIGAPLGLAGTVTTGIISATDRPVDLSEDATGEGAEIEALQTDAAINPGNSGGPLVDQQGRVIGVNTAIATLGGGTSGGGQGGSIGLGFAIPAAEVEEIVDGILSGAGSGDAQEGEDVLGLVLDSDYDQGARITSDDEAGGSAIEPGGPADQAGLEAGDVIIGFDDQDVADSDTLDELLGQYEADDRIEIVFERDGDRGTTDITLG